MHRYYSYISRSRGLAFFKGFDIPAPDFRVRFSDEVKCRFDGIIERRSGGFDIVLQAKTAGKGLGARMGGRRAMPFLYYLAKSPDSVERLKFHFSDGFELSLGGFFFSSYRADAGLIPDQYFHESQGFPEVRAKIGLQDVAWDSRSSDLVWRGGVNGEGLVTAEKALATHPALLPRIRCAWLCKDSAIDFGFAPEPHRSFDPVFETVGMVKPRVPTDSWFGRKYALDIDGYSSTWDNLFHRMLMGCCVLKIESDHGYRQWYYDRLRPWEHFVPVRADMSDLFEKYEWVQSHDAQAREIAANGRALTLSMTFETETAVTVQHIKDMWQSHF